MGGRVVNIASTEGSGATLCNAAYVAAKHGSVGLTKALAVEFASQGICVNCVQPGPIRTGMTKMIPEKSKDYYAKPGANAALRTARGGCACCGLIVFARVPLGQRGHHPSG